MRDPLIAPLIARLLHWKRAQRKRRARERAGSRRSSVSSCSCCSPSRARRSRGSGRSSRCTSSSGCCCSGPVALKLAATGYRFARYYTGGPEYVRERPARAADARPRRAGARPLDAHAVRDRRRAPRRPAPGRRARAAQGELHRLVRRDDDPRARLRAARAHSACAGTSRRAACPAGGSGSRPPGSPSRRASGSRSRPTRSPRRGSIRTGRFEGDAARPAVAARTTSRRPPRAPQPRTDPAWVALRLPPVHPGPLPGYLLIADRNNNRALVVSPDGKVVWADSALRGPDDAFFTPAGTRSSPTRSSTTR